MHFYNETGSVVNMAQQLLRDIDRTAVETRISTAQLDLILRTLVELGQPAAHQTVSDTASRQLGSIRTAFSDAERAR